METVRVNANALRQVLNALSGPEHMMRELKVIRGLPGGDDPIGTLIREFNAAVEAHNAGESDIPKTGQTEKEDPVK